MNRFSLIIVLLHVVYLFTQSTGCEAKLVDWIEAVGCYKDTPSRAMGAMFLNYRSKINWRKWPDLSDIINACALAARERGLVYFAVQNFGECWGDEFSNKSFAEYGPSDQCVNGVGKPHANMVYRGKCSSVWGCCKDGVHPAQGPQQQGCEAMPATQPPKEYACSKKIDLALIVDSSFSIRRQNFEKVRQFTKQFADSFKISNKTVQLGLIEYSSKVKLLFDFSVIQSNSLVQTCINALLLYMGRGTRTVDALDIADRKVFVPVAGMRQQDDVRRVAVIVTDGRSQGRKRIMAASRKLKIKNVHVIAVGVGPLIDMIELKAMVTDPSKDIITMNDFDALAQSGLDIANFVCA